MCLYGIPAHDGKNQPIEPLHCAQGNVLENWPAKSCSEATSKNSCCRNKSWKKKRKKVGITSSDKRSGCLHAAFDPLEFDISTSV